MQNGLSYFSCGYMMTCINIGVLSCSFHCNQIHATPNKLGLEKVQMCVPMSGYLFATPLCYPFALTDEMQMFTSHACETQISQKEKVESPWSCSSFRTCSEVCLHGKGEG